MAISAPHYRCLRGLCRRGELPQGARILEFGEANWYGDVPLEQLQSDFGELPEVAGEWAAWDVVKWLYVKLFDASLVRSIDFAGTPAAVKTDLNYEVEGHGLYQVCINHGTAEHVFNIANVFRAMHDNCAVGGLMIHESPFTGWIDHGFWTIQPTAYFDLCDANGYELVFMAVTHIDHNSATPIESREQLLHMAANGGVPNNAMLYVAMRKQNGGKFKIPTQGVYAGTLSEPAKLAWSTLR